MERQPHETAGEWHMSSTTIRVPYSFTYSPLKTLPYPTLPYRIKLSTEVGSALCSHTAPAKKVGGVCLASGLIKYHPESITSNEPVTGMLVCSTVVKHAVGPPSLSSTRGRGDAVAHLDGCVPDSSGVHGTSRDFIRYQASNPPRLATIHHPPSTIYHPYERPRHGT